MAPQQSKPLDDDALDDAAKARNVRVLLLSGFMAMTSMSVVAQSSPILVTRGVGGDRVKAISALTQLTSATAALEFLLNPLFGGLADAFGRKPFLMLLPAMMLAFRGAVARDPSLRNLRVARILVGAVMPAFMTAQQAAIGDMYKGGDAGMISKRVGIGGQIGSMMGLSMIVCGMLGGRLTARDVVLPYRFSAAVSAFTLGVLALGFRETLPHRERRPATLRTGNPLAFLRLFRGSALFAKLNVIHAFRMAPMGMYDISSAFAREVRGWGPRESGRFQSVSGACSMVTMALMGRVVAALGPKLHTRVFSLCSVLGYAAYANSTTTPRAYAALALQSPGTMAGSAIGALSTQLGTDEGLGRGEMAGARANLDALIKSAVPLVFGRLYAIGTRRGVPGLAYYAAAACVGVAGLLSLTLRDDEWVPGKGRGGAPAAAEPRRGSGPLPSPALRP